MAIENRSIYPTHTCFDNALDFIAAVLQENPDDRDVLVTELSLVHGICLAPDGQPYAHAWVEHGAHCIFAGILDGKQKYFAAFHDDYYAELGVQEVTRYTLQDALTHNRRTGHYGPWERRYRALCGRQEEPHHG